VTWRVGSGLAAREAPVLPSSPLRLLAGNLLLGLGYYGLARLGGVVQLTGQVQVAWLPVGYAAAALYLGDMRWFAGGAIADMLLGTGVYPFHYQLIPTAEVWFETLGNTAEFVIAALLMRRLLGRGTRLDRPYEVAGMALALSAGVTLSATIGTVSVWLDNAAAAADLWTIWYTWWLGDMSGGLLVAPLMLVWAQRPLAGAGLPTRRRLIGQAAGALTLVVVLSIAAFSMSYPLPYVVFPGLILAATYLGLRGATLALALALAVAIGMTAARRAPFAQQSITSEVLSTQLYILVATLTTLTIGAAVSARRQAAAELAQTQRQAAERAEQERQRIARDLHDSVSQTLFSLGLHAGIAKHEASRAELPAASALPAAIAEMAALAQAALLEMRASIFDLRGDAVAEQGLVTALAAHGAALTVRHDVRVTVTGPDDRLPLSPRTEELLYRIGQEAITNAVKHSGSQAVCAQVSADDSLVTLTVRDHGGGFDPGSPYAGHLGLVLMRSRAAETGGTVDVTSTPGGGTTVRAAVPAGPRAATGLAGLPAPRGQLAGPPESVT
jgi:signal transduction histidine kinase